MSNFFDQYPSFFETSKTGNAPNRLNKRFQAIFGQPEIFKGARVLDIASHDGRWSFAALHCGAMHVTGVEARQHLVQNANRNLAPHFAADRYTFVQSDIFEYLHKDRTPVEVVLCLGFFYHTYRQPELLALINRKKPRFLVVDSQVNLSKEMVSLVERDRVSEEPNAVQDPYGVDGWTYAATPSVKLLTDMIWTFGFKLKQIDWNTIKGDNINGIEDYAEGRRATFICEER